LDSTFSSVGLHSTSGGLDILVGLHAYIYLFIYLFIHYATEAAHITLTSYFSSVSGAVHGSSPL